MKSLWNLKAALVGGASVVALVQVANAKVFDIPDGDLSAALSAYVKQSNAEILYVEEVVRGHKSRGARGDYTETAALTQILQGTGFTTRITASHAIEIVSQAAASVRVAQAAPRRPAAAQASSGIETIVVTAERKQENIQQVPIAVTALSQTQLTERQIAGGPDLIKEVPNLTFSKTNFTGYNIQIRGIGTQAISVTTDPAVAVALNGIPFIRNHFFEQEFYDLADAEVLRGPQGTLWGRNATAGVVNIKSAQPTDTYEAMLSADLGNFSNRRLEAMLNLPIVGDKLDIRMAAEWTKRDGYSINALTNSPIDGRDLWSGRASLRWRPNADIDANLVWEHFSENDDRMRTAKQLCKTSPIPTSIDGIPIAPGGAAQGSFFDFRDYLSQGCEMTSLYSPDAFQVPNGYTLPYYAGIESILPLRQGFNVYASTTQSQNLRVIESSINPVYKAKNDTLELNVDYKITPSLTFTSLTGYNRDFLWSTEDYNRFNSAPGAFVWDPQRQFLTNNAITPDPSGLGHCIENATSGVCQGLPPIASCKPSSLNDPICTPDGVFCDPQLGCSDRLVAQDLSDERSWQLSQEFRLASNFSGPLNFSVGGNYLHYETVENYYVFINTLSLLSLHNSNATQYVPGVTDNSECLPGGFRTPNTIITRSILGPCWYIDPNPLNSLNNEGHNYFLSQNPYVLNSYAVFGEAYYNLTDDFKLTAGLRWTEDEKHFIDIPSELVLSGYGYPIADVVDQKWDRLTGRAAANWTPKLDFTDQTLVYASFAHGYKAGGANPPGAIYPTIVQAGNFQTNNPIHPLTFKPEYIEAFELGTKNTVLDGAMTLNGDLFYYNYHNYQISRIIDRTAINDNFNATVRGAELETTWEPAPGLKFSFAGGYEDATLNHGDQSVDLMDRTAGNPNWIVVKPLVTESSNCILPIYVVGAILRDSSDKVTVADACDNAYTGHLDPATGLPYVQNPTITVDGVTPPANYPGFNPLTAPNNGQGFNKNLSGNQLPNAPHFTASFTAEYTRPLSEEWAATLHGDFYWQADSWARVFNDNPYDRLHGYTNLNLALILNSANGWQVMGYVKNVFNVTAITGDFLNSDDSGLTTNVFLTDPRLYGVRVTKQLDQNDGFWGSDYSGYDFFTGLFSDADNGKPPLWIELGGGLNRLSDSQQQFSPPFMSLITQKNLLRALNVQQPPAYTLDEEAKISFQPDGSDWVVSASVRYGRSRAQRHLHQQTANKDVPFNYSISFYGFHLHNEGIYYPTQHVKFADGQSSQSVSHLILDFQAGKDVGLGMFGLQGSSVVSAGVRVAQFASKQSVNLHAEPDLQYPTAPITSKYEMNQFRNAKIRFHDYGASAVKQQSFHGIGPEVMWNASTPVVGNEGGNGVIALDWGVNAGVLFGRQRANGHHQTAVRSYYRTRWHGGFNKTGKLTPGSFNKGASNYQTCAGEALNEGAGGVGPGPYACNTNSPVFHNRSREVTVPNLGGFLGASYRYQNAKISFGYRADVFFGAIDGGIDTYKSETRAFYGPFATVSIGLGG